MTKPPRRDPAPSQRAEPTLEPPRPLHPRRGIHDPVRSTPDRVPGSVRRTSTTDMLWPEGPGQTLHLRGRARDLHTDADGNGHVLDEASLDVGVDYAADRRVAEIRATPDERALQELLATRASTGFRGAVDACVPQLRDAYALLYLLLDDVPVAALVGGYSLGAAVGTHTPAPKALALQHPDLCAGWARGATILTEIEAHGRIPVVTGPLAPDLRCNDDPLAWHALSPLPAHGMRRHRRLDVVPTGAALRLDVLFRDSHMAPGGRETIVHEYTVRATVDRDTLEIREITATPQVLPWLECPRAADSARDLVGLPLAGLRPHLRAALTGSRSCTHLTDTLRSLEDVVVLVDLL